MATARKAMGTTLKRGDGGSPEVFTTIGRMHNFTGPGLTAKEIDVTALDNTSGYAEFLLGVKDGGRFTFELEWDPGDAQHQKLLDDFTATQASNYQVVWTDPGMRKWQWNAYVLGFTTKGDPNTALTATVELRITGAPNFNA